MQSSEEMRLVRVLSVTPVATDIKLFELAPADGRPLPAAAPGAHIDVTTPEGPVRQYSLCEEAAAGGNYRIAVKKEAQGRGGSLSMHERVQAGDCLAIAGPRNHFPLAAGQHSTLLIAGGIGITPIRAMARSLHAAGQPWQLHYCARSAEHAAFCEDLQALDKERVTTWFSETPLMDVPALLAEPRPDTHLYCCGPAPLMQAVKDATAAWPEGSVHFEWFSAPAVDHAADQPFEVELASSKRVLHVPADKSLLEVLRDEGLFINSACEEGVCGTCETRILAGQADHRDLLLSEEERAANASMMVCVSRACSARIVLDL